MNFIFLIISLVLVSGFVGSVFAQVVTVEKEYTFARDSRNGGQGSSHHYE